MSSIPREALNANASNPGVMVVASSALNACAIAITSCGSWISLGLILLTTSAARYLGERSGRTAQDRDPLSLSAPARRLRPRAVTRKPCAQAQQLCSPFPISVCALGHIGRCTKEALAISFRNERGPACLL